MMIRERPRAVSHGVEAAAVKCVLDALDRVCVASAKQMLPSC